MIYKLGEKIINHCGEKIKYLSILKSRGYNVPYGVVIDFEEFKKLVKDQDLDFDTIGNLRISEELIDNLKALLQENKQYVVRSSYSLKNDSDVNIACKYNTFLNVSNRKESLKETIKSCFLSLYSTENLKYYKDNRIDINNVEMNIVIQEMIDSNISGVLFTLNPTSGKDTEIVVEYAKGYNEISTDKVKPDRIIYDWIKEKYVQEPQRKILGDNILKELISISLNLQQDLKSPINIEFGVYDSRLYIFQAKLIRKIEFKNVYSHYSNTIFRDNNYSNSSSSRFMWSLYERAWNYSFYNFFRDSKILNEEEIGNSLTMLKFSRPYWNVTTLKRALKKIPGYVEEEFDEEIGVLSNDSEEGKITPKTLKVKNAFKMVLKRQVKNFKYIKNENKMKIVDIKNRIDDMTREELESDFGNIINGLYIDNESSYFMQIFINNIYNIYLKNSLRKYLSKEQYNKLLLGIEKVSDTKPYYHMWNSSRSIRNDAEKLSFFENNLDAEIFYMYRKDRDNENIKEFLTDFIDNYGYNSFSGSEVIYKKYDEDILRVIKMYRDILELDEDNVGIERSKQIEEYNDLIEFLKTKVGKYKFALLNKKIQLMRKLLEEKEELIDISMMTYDLLRKYMLKLGEYYKNEFVIEEAEEIFHLSIGDILEYISTHDEWRLKKKIVKNRTYFKSFENYKSLKDIQASQISYIDTRYQNKLTGIGACSGKKQGYARIVESVEQLKSLSKNEIAITKYTDTKWTPFFNNLPGIVTEYGGMLCHCAITSREYNIPCIVGVNDVTQKIKTGDYILIDGMTGEVIIQ